MQVLHVVNGRTVHICTSIMCLVIISAQTYTDARSTIHYNNKNRFFDKTFRVDINDILNDKLIPIQLFLQDESILEKCNTDVESKKYMETLQNCNFNSSDTSLALMAYHRRMINEFMATEYLTHNILNRNSYNDTKAIGKRKGLARRDVKHTSMQKLLDDEGMTKYKSWLEKSTTLTDIQQHLDKFSPHLQMGQEYELSRGQAAELDSDFKSNELEEDGDITGYALNSSPIEPDLIMKLPLDNQMNVFAKSSAVNKNGYDSRFDEYGIRAASDQSYQHLSQPPPIPKIPQREIGLKDITDIALTTLAFLSFGMFILQVLMCITMSKEESNNMMVLPMENTDPDDLPEPDEADEIRRRKRSIFDYSQNITMVNELARKILPSLQETLLLFKNGSSCHYLLLCENNRLTRQQHGHFELWIPIWSLGVSWFASYRSTETNKNPNENIAPMKSLAAVMAGKFGHSTCRTLFENTCNKSN